MADLTGLPIVTAFDSRTAPMEGPVSALVRDAAGDLFVGSNQLSVFDGGKWEAIPTPATYAFRALSAAGLRVWVGAFSQMGYVERGPDGSWRYVETKPDPAKLDFGPIGDVWSVQALGDGAVWVTSDRLIRVQGGQWETWKLSATPHLVAFPDDAGIDVYQSGVGLLRIERAGPPKLVIADSELPERPVTWLALPLIGLGDEAYRWTAGHHFERLDGLSAKLKGRLPGNAVKVGADTVAIGTLNGGVVMASLTTGSALAHWQKHDGLRDNSTYALAAEGAAGLWVGLPSGFVRLSGLGVVSLIDERSGLDGGSPKKFVWADQADVLTNHALYQLDRGHASPILDHEASLWDAVAIKGQLWVGGFGGIWRIDHGQAERALTVSAVAAKLSPSIRLPGSILFVEDYRLKELHASPHGGWAERDLGAQLPEGPVSLLQDATGTVWMSSTLGQIRRYSWVDRGALPPDLVLTTKITSDGGPAQKASRPVLSLAAKQVVAFRDDGIFAYQFGAFDLLPSFERFRGLAATDGDVAYWIVQTRGQTGERAAAVIRVEPDAQGHLGWNPVEVAGLEQIAPLTCIGARDSQLWIGGDHGVLAVNLDRAEKAPPPPPVQLHSRGGEIVFASAATIDGRAITYESRLKGVDQGWMGASEAASRSVAGLAPGHYTFEARAVDRWGQAGPVASLALFVASPWYASWPAWTCYAAVVALMVWSVVRFRFARLQRQNETLNRLVAERTKTLELSNRAKSDFLENISHEVRNPLTGLTGLLEMLQEEELKPRERELARSLKASAQHLSRVCEEILGFSKLEYGYVSLQKRNFSLVKLVGELRDLYAVQAESRQCRIEIAIQESFTDGFYGDDGKIKTIVGNFIANAIKYAPGQPVEIRVEAADSEGAAIELAESALPVTIEVADHGPGVPEKEQDLIFQKFVRGTNAKQVAGAGLGLATCSILAKAINGYIGLENEPGQGATFYLRVWLTRSPQPAAQAQRAAEENRPDTSARPVLIVEDEPYNQTVLKGIAARLGFLADVAASAEQAIERLGRHQYAVVFLDWELPGAKGGEVARWLRERESADRSQSPAIIIATTANDSEEMREKCRAAGMDDFLLKPYDKAGVEQLLAQIRARRAGLPEFDRLVSTKPGQDGINREVFVNYGQAEPGLAERAVADFLAAVDTETAELEGALRTNDGDRLAKSAHRMQALAGLVGAREAKESARRIQEQARTASAADRKSLVAGLAEALKTLKGRIKSTPYQE